MRIECTECERDLRAGHEVDCSRRPRNHSPAPWTWEREQHEWPDHQLIDGHGDAVLQWDMDLGFAFGSRDDEMLIAAAPDLLAACLRVLEGMPKGPPTLETYDAIRNAVARTTRTADLARRETQMNLVVYGCRVCGATETSTHRPSCCGSVMRRLGLHFPKDLTAGDSIRIRDHDGAERIVTVLGWQAGTGDMWVHDGKEGFSIGEDQIIGKRG